MRPRHLAVIAAVLALGIATLLAAAPAIIRALAVRQIEGLTGRDASIGDVDLNLFARHLVLRDVRVVGLAERPPVLHIPRVDVRFHLRPVLRGRIDCDRWRSTNRSSVCTAPPTAG